MITFIYSDCRKRYPGYLTSLFIDMNVWRSLMGYHLSFPLPIHFPMILILSPPFTTPETRTSLPNTTSFTFHAVPLLFLLPPLFVSFLGHLFFPIRSASKALQNAHIKCLSFPHFFVFRLPSFRLFSSLKRPF